MHHKQQRWNQKMKISEKMQICKEGDQKMLSFISELLWILLVFY